MISGQWDDQTRLDLFPVFIVHLEGAHVVLDGYNHAVTRDKLLGDGASEVCSRAQGNNGGKGVALFLITKGARVESFLCAGKVCDISFPGIHIATCLRSLGILTIDGKLPLHRVRLHLAPGEPLGILVHVVVVILVVSLALCMVESS